MPSTNADLVDEDAEVLPAAGAAGAAVLSAPSLLLRAPLRQLLLTLSGCQLEVTDPRPRSCGLDEQRASKGRSPAWTLEQQLGPDGQSVLGWESVWKRGWCPPGDA